MSISVARRREAPGNPKIDAYGMSPLASVSRLNRVSSLLVFCAATVCLGCSDDDAVTDPDSEEGSSVEPLVPLITGHRSTFRFVALDSSMPMIETCDDPFTEVGEMATIEGITGVRYLSFCSDTEVLLEGSGDSLTAHIIDPTGTALGAATEYIHSPVEIGESWQTSTTTYLWAEATQQPLTVPGGTFDACWDRVAPPALTTFTYCRGIGLVVGVSLSGNWRIELASKNF